MGFAEQGGMLGEFLGGIGSVREWGGRFIRQERHSCRQCQVCAGI